MEQEVVNILTSLVTSVGFPIVCCYFLYTYINKKDSQLTEITSLHHDELKAMTNALNANTVVLERLVKQVEDLEDRD